MGSVSQLPGAADRKVRQRHVTGPQLAELGIPRILPVIDYVDPRRSHSAAMVIAEAILAQMTPEQRQAAKGAVYRLDREIGTDQTRAAAAFMLGVLR